MVEVDIGILFLNIANEIYLFLPLQLKSGFAVSCSIMDTTASVDLILGEIPLQEGKNKMDLRKDIE